ncbi:MAG: methyltransferase domain-containing protein [Spirochaetes bacterium]|nr:methyltransferase domain-containing protein [Spirochaetota bacterium]
MKNDEIIESARKRFDEQLHTVGYKAVHSDSEHLKNLIELFDIKKNKSYLDLGTGNSYIAFELTQKFQNITVYGLDIAKNSTAKNNIIKLNKGLKNIYFDCFGGVDFPYNDKMFYGTISRYAFHHFPNIKKTLSELKILIENGGFFILSDPLTYDNDKENFIDEFQSMIPDGHVHFYRREEIDNLFKKYDFTTEKEFYSFIRFPRKMNENYKKLINKTCGKILDKYQLGINDDKIFITVKVMNILFRHLF